MSVGSINEFRPASLPVRAIRPNRRVLEPIERISEVLFGLIMVLSITCSFSILNAGREEVRTMLIGALGCNLAWGLIDACMYLMACFNSRAEGVRALQALRRTPDSAHAHSIIADALPPLIASVMSKEDFESVRQKLIVLPEPDPPRLVRENWLGALGVLLLVFLSTLPVVVPFTITANARRALRISNFVALGMLFLTGYAFGRSLGRPAWTNGLGMVFLGAILVLITIALGG